MTKSELNKYRTVLETKQADLVHMIRNRDGIAIEKSADALDEVQYATERELAIRSLDRDSNLLRNVRAALERIEEGSLACACTATRISVPNAWRQCRRRHSASCARNSPTVASTMAPTPSTSC